MDTTKQAKITDGERWEDIVLSKLDDTSEKARFLYSDSTTDYSMFSYHPQNRKLIPYKVKVIAESMTRFGNCGIIKTRNSRIIKVKKETFDGQHTLEACKLLKIPVNYAHFENVPLRVMIELNKNTTAWKLPDYLQFGVGERIKDYILLEKYLKANQKPKEFGISSLICLLNGSQSTKVFKGMGLKIRRQEYADIVISYLHDFSEYITHWNHTKFVWAMCRVVDTDKYNHEHMMSKVRMASDKFRNASGVEGHKQAIEDMYNFRSRDIVRFV